MKFLLIFSVIIIAAFVLLVTILIHPFQTEVVNQATLNASGITVVNQSDWSYWDKIVAFWPAIPIVLMAGLIFWAIYKAIHH